MKTFAFKCPYLSAPFFLLLFCTTLHAQDDRSKSGVLDSTGMSKLHTYLAHCTDRTVPLHEKIAIVYYPGKDDCNSRSIWTQDEAFIEMNAERFNKALAKLGNTTMINIYKNDEGLDLQKKHTVWYPDKEHKIEKLFFKQHYPCYSFVVIAPSGNFYAYYGEYADAQIFEALKLVN